MDVFNRVCITGLKSLLSVQTVYDVSEVIGFRPLSNPSIKLVKSQGLNSAYICFSYMVFIRDHVFLICVRLFCMCDFAFLIFIMNIA